MAMVSSLPSALSAALTSSGHVGLPAFGLGWQRRPGRDARAEAAASCRHTATGIVPM